LSFNIFIFIISLSDKVVSIKFLDPAYHQGESFLLLSREEWERVRNRRSLTGVRPSYQDEHFVIIRYPSVAVIHGELLAREK